MNSDREYDSDSDLDEDVLKFNDLAAPQIVEKYMQSSKITNEALKYAMSLVKPGAYIGEICKATDKYIHDEANSIYKHLVDGKSIRRGVAMPTCLAVNEVIGHYAPAWPVEEKASTGGLQKKSDFLDTAEGQLLKEGDLVAIDLGTHIDGYISQVAHTVLCTDKKEEVTGRKADVIQAAWKCAEAAHRMIKKGADSDKITEIWGKICADYKCKPMMGTMSCNMRQHVIDGTKTFPMSEKIQEEDMQHDPGFQFQENQLFAVDIMVSTGEGKFHEMPVATTVHKRDVEMKYHLKTEKARDFYGQVTKKFPTLPFHSRYFLEDESKKNGALLGLKQATQNSLLEPYLPMMEAKGEFCAQFKFTLGVFPAGPKKLTGHLFDQNNIMKSEHKVENEDALAVLALPQPGAGKKKKNNKKK